MKIELKHLAPYLPYGLKVQYLELDENGMQEGGIANLQGLYCDDDIATFSDCMDYYFGQDNDVEIKPILRPLSDYTDITSKSMSDLDCDLTDQMDIQEFALKKMSLSSLLYSSFDVLTRNHVDIFGLIPEGLAIDINTL